MLVSEQKDTVLPSVASFTAAPMVVGFFVVFCSSYIKNAFATAGRVLGRKRREDMVMRYERDEKNRLYRRD